MSNSESVSVIIPTLNGLLRSDGVLLGLERQSFIKNILEVIIVDDASRILGKEALYEKIKEKFPRLNIVVLYHKKNAGPAAARNSGAKIAKGDFFFFTDDDCDLPSNWIEEHLGAYEKHPVVSSIGGWYKPFNKDLIKSLSETYIEIFYKHRYGNLFFSQWDSRVLTGMKFPAINTANLSVKRYVFDFVQFDEDFIAPGFEDRFFSESIRRAGYIMYYIPLFVYHHKEMKLKNFIRLCMNRGMGSYVYDEKYGRKASRSYRNENSWDMIQRSSQIFCFSYTKKLKLFFLDYINYFFFYSKIMRYYYKYKYFKKMHRYPKLFLNLWENRV